MLEALREKTLKREVAVALMGFVCLIAWKAANTEVEEKEINQALEVLKLILWPAVIFLGGAFGMDWVGKQTGLVK